MSKIKIADQKKMLGLGTYPQKMPLMQNRKIDFQLHQLVIFPQTFKRTFRRLRCLRLTNARAR